MMSDRVNMSVFCCVVGYVGVGKVSVACRRDVYVAVH